MNHPVPDNIPEGLPFGPSPGYPNQDQFHYGKDWLAPKGTPCWFRESGVITFVGLLGELGTYVQLWSDRDPARWWGLAHLSATEVAVGQVVNAGEPVGRTGGVPGEYGAGKSTGAHVHEECRVGWQWGERVDPDSVILEEDMNKEKLEAALNRLWDIRLAFEAGAPMSPQFAALSQELFDIIVDVKVATGLQ